MGAREAIAAWLCGIAALMAFGGWRSWRSRSETGASRYRRP